MGRHYLELVYAHHLESERKKEREREGGKEREREREQSATFLGRSSEWLLSRLRGNGEASNSKSELCRRYFFFLFTGCGELVCVCVYMCVCVLRVM